MINNTILGHNIHLENIEVKFTKILILTCRHSIIHRGSVSADSTGGGS